MDLKICFVSVEDILPLRHEVLRQGLPAETAKFDGDNLPTTLHFGSFLTTKEKGNSLVGCASFFLVPFTFEPAYQLRGMAVTSNHHGLGIGKTLLESSMAKMILVGPNGIRLFWCNARGSAIGFYQKQGWTVISEPFDIPGAGPHSKMIKRV